MSIIKHKLIVFLFITSGLCHAQFLDNFDKDKIDGWFFFTGDGSAEMDFMQNDGYATIVVDGTKDKHNVYWTLIKRDVTSFLDLNKLKDTSYQLRVEAKVRLHNAPRRVNFMVNHNRTTDYHKDLMEFDIPDTTNWHVISMTTKKFDAQPGDTVYVQLAATDYGLGKYYVDLDYYRADIVNVSTAGPDKGVQIPYHPAVPELNTFSNHYDAVHDALIVSDFPEVNFNNWSVKEKNENANVLTVNTNKWAVLRWDPAKFKNVKADTSGILELTTYSVTKGGDYIKAYGEEFGIEFGKVRVIEILGGDPEWEQTEVTYNNFMQGKKYPEIFNEQMTVDKEPSDEPGGKNYITLSKPVMQRLLDGTTKGLLIRPLGALDFSFYSSENPDSSKRPKLHFNTVE
ncbi:MAG: hypothetical protein R6W90_01390 [Ignavibacteriaceae bacterium]